MTTTGAAEYRHLKDLECKLTSRKEVKNKASHWHNLKFIPLGGVRVFCDSVMWG